MTEEQAQCWIKDRFGSEAYERVAAFLSYVVEENGRQNLISPSTIASIWSRHAVDSAQLLLLAPAGWSSWLDVGTGGGFPGMIVALLTDRQSVIMVEPRRRRADFLASMVADLGLGSADVVASKVESVRATVEVISARAVATVEALVRSARHCAIDHTTWLLPRGTSISDLPLFTRSVFHVEHSVTNPESAILVIRGDGR